MRCSSPLSIKDPRQSLGSIRLTVPCGKCGQCKENRRLQWSFRLNEEYRNASSAYFVTLTYNPKQLPRAKNGRPTVDKTHLQKFIKRARRYQNDNNIRYYAVSEYGSKTLRPHYHVIMFNVNKRTIDRLSALWSTKEGNRRGFAYISDLTFGRIYYVAKYHVNADKEKMKGLGVEPEQAFMSKGIGKSYIKRAGSWNLKNRIKYVMDNGYKKALPRYLRDKIFKNEPVLIGKELEMARVIQSSDKEYAEEVERLIKLGEKQPTQEIDYRAMKQSEKILKDSKSKDQL